VVVFQIQVADFAFCDVDTERQAAITCDAEAPCALAVTGQCVHLPCWERAQFLGVVHVIEKRQHLAELVRRIGRNAFGAVLRVELLQALMGKVPYFHPTNCSLSLNTCQARL
jgi:hypothetical protein